ncbi:MAG TPA: MFS transporter [Steroidobacteraceae bacterium]|nr:MFS transporter [Steroidobacteraceae bacterium]
MDARHVIAADEMIETDVPARLDRLSWSRFHSLVVLALGITWVLDGLEVTLVGAISGALKASPSLHLSDAEVGGAASAYLAGAVLGALVFGWLTDAWGRKRLFFITLGLYVAATAASALAQSFIAFALFRFLTGCGIGGEYTAINSAIQELVPARYRGRTDLAINGSFWLGALVGSFATTLLLAPGRLPLDMGWRVAFGIGAALGLVILAFRRTLPESPRWLVLHGREGEAEHTVDEIERRAKQPTARGAARASLPRIKLRAHHEPVGPLTVGITLFRLYPRRAVLGLVLMSAQAFFYNAIFFTHALVLERFFGVRTNQVGLYLVPFTVSNFIGPLALGWLFDHWGRRPMITATYGMAGGLLALTALAFDGGALGAASLTMAFTAVFFFASPAASSAYLTVSESFPLEVRALAIAVFYAFGTALGGVAAPWIFGALIGTGRASAIARGYGFGAGLMIVAAVVEAWLGIAAERKPLEEVAQPLSSQETAVRPRRRGGQR